MDTFERLTTRDGEVGGLAIRRALPNRLRRLVGPWCFLDHLGPADLLPPQTMRVAPHPHIGLQTFTWMIEGEILHRDSRGTEQVIRPGQVNLMTAGRGICHSEELVPGMQRLHTVQLWIALPDALREMPAEFTNYPILPVVRRDGIVFTVLAGRSLGETAPTRVHSPIIGLDVFAPGAASTVLPLDASFEHAVLVTEGLAALDGEAVGPGMLFYLPPGRESLALTWQNRGRLLMVGGAPFGEQVLLWWNFVARDPAEIRRAAADWNAGEGDFGEVIGYDGERLLAPDASHIRAPGAGG